MAFSLKNKWVLIISKTSGSRRSPCICVNMAFLSFAMTCLSCCICVKFSSDSYYILYVFDCRVHVSSWQLPSLHALCLWFPKHWLWMLLRMLQTWWQSWEPITIRAKPRLSMHSSSGKYCGSVVEFGDKAIRTSQDLRFSTVVWPGIQVSWVVTLCCWASSSCIEGSQCLHLHGSSVMLQGEGTAVLPNTWNHSSNIALHLRRPVFFKNALLQSIGMGVHR